ncbi:MAG: EamA/RhaT family transporter [Bacteroidia bacterium]|nr:EamA/RhaT family transporter [Bacteroidia bacterium]MCZ2248741.1 EamA/RhaT family transporter [Bacteroidia bacterium]
MIYIILCILINAGLILVFKLFPKYNIDNFQAIVANYFVAAFLGFQIAEQKFDIQTMAQQAWFIYALFLGLLFVSIFYLISITTIVWGVSVATVANKMSIVIPVSLAVYLFNESLSFIQILGILLAMISVVLVSKKRDDAAIKIDKKWYYFLPVILFIGCGAIDALIGYLQKIFVGTDYSNEFILSTAFMFAAISGGVVFAFLLILKKIKWHTKSIITGILLGIPNFFSMYFIMKSLESNVLNASTFFPVNNMSIVVVATVVSVWAYKEKLSRLNIAGVILSIAAIVLIALL